uniref:Uncharacterized protein n=2 Tax=Pseudo-nitzschia australis TaxID=44445 RepID=A0A7S4ARZ0_9STRA
MKTNEQRFWPLFIAIDYDTFSDELCAVIHLDLIAEATIVLSYLPVYLHAQFGVQTWQWFLVKCKKEMSNYTWHEDEHRLVCTKDDESDSPVQPLTNAPFVAWENVDGDDVEISQTTLFDFRPRDGHGTDSGFNDQNSLATMATNTTQLTTILGSFTDPILLAEQDQDDDEDKTMPLVDDVMTSTASFSEITNDVDRSTPKAPDQTSFHLHLPLLSVQALALRLPTLLLLQPPNDRLE